MSADRPTLNSYAEFWPYYLQQHAQPGTRALHYIGTFIVLDLAFWAVFTQTWWLLLMMPVVGYGFAWTGHVFIEGNKPATFGHPFWSLYSDFRMFFLWLTGRLRPHLEKAGV